MKDRDCEQCGHEIRLHDESPLVLCGHCQQVADLKAEVSRLEKWQQTPNGANSSGLEQINRVVAGLIREYGDQGKVLNLSRETANGVPLGQQIQWRCSGRSLDYIVIREVAAEPTEE